MWQGILQGLMLADEERAKKEERDETRRFREEDVAFRREQFETQNRLARQKMAIELLPIMQQRSAASSALAGQASILRGYLGNSPVVDSLVSSGNSEAVSRIISNLEKNYESAQQEGRGEEFLTNFRVTIENDYRIDPAGTGEIDFSLFEDLVSEQDFESLGLPKTFTIPGSVEGRPVVYQQTATLEDLNSVERRIGNFAVDQGNREVARIRRGVTQITEMLSDPSLDPTVAANLRSDLIALTDRRMLVDAALDDAKGDNASFGSVLNLYGNDAADRVLTSGPRSIDPSNLSPTFTDLISRQPITVVSPEQAQRFFELGVITESDSIIYNGRQYPVRDLFED
jgi:hypothetical protein